MSARDDGAVTPSAGAVTFTATPPPGQLPTSVITQPTLFIDWSRGCWRVVMAELRACPWTLTLVALHFPQTGNSSPCPVLS